MSHDDGPPWTAITVAALGSAALAMLLLVAFGTFNLTCGTTYRAAAEAQNVALEEFGARGLLDKYRYFKRVAASLEAKAANAALMEARASATEKTYGLDASKWPRDVRERVALDQDALYALKASFNQLAAEYNAAMSDQTKAFMNRGDWPRGWPADERQPLRREYAEYRLR